MFSSGGADGALPADAMATNLRLRLRALDEIEDAKARQLEQWKTVLDVTAAIKRPRIPIT